MTRRTGTALKRGALILGFVLLATACPPPTPTAEETDEGDDLDFDEDSDESVDDQSVDESTVDEEATTPGDGFDLSEVPILPDGTFELHVEPVAGCGTPPAGGSVIIVPHASSRGLAASVSGDIDGTLHIGNGSIVFNGRTAHTTRDDVPSADTDHLTLVPGSDGLEGVWQHRLLEGTDAESVGIDEGVCEFGGNITLTSEAYPLLRDAINNAPPLDLDVLQVEDLVCEQTPDGIRVTGRAPGAVAGEGILLQGSISADEFIELGESLAVVGDDGRFEATFSYDGDETHVSVVARRGVYQAGGQFFEGCE